LGAMNLPAPSAVASHRNVLFFPRTSTFAPGLAPHPLTVNVVPGGPEVGSRLAGVVQLETGVSVGVAGVLFVGVFVAVLAEAGVSVEAGASVGAGVSDGSGVSAGVSVGVSAGTSACAGDTDRAPTVTEVGVGASRSPTRTIVRSTESIVGREDIILPPSLL
jgi:hypothetical protein